jgi:hypothetical protein
MGADEVAVYFQISRHIEEGLLPRLTDAAGAIGSLAGNLSQRGPEKTAKLLDDLRLSLIAPIDTLTNDFQQTTRFISLDDNKREFARVKDAWWTAYNKMVADIGALPDVPTGPQIEILTGHDAQQWNDANVAFQKWANDFIQEVRDIKRQ